MKHNDERRAKAEKILSGAGYGKAKSLARKGDYEHEAKAHGGKKLKLAHGGSAEGEEAKERMDRPCRASGGRNKAKGSKVNINIIAAGGKEPMPMPSSGAINRPMPPAPAPMAQRPPMAPAGAMPPGGMPGKPFKSGGTVKLEGGAGGGKARLEKAAHEKTRKKPR